MIDDRLRSIQVRKDARNHAERRMYQAADSWPDLSG